MKPRSSLGIASLLLVASSVCVIVSGSSTSKPRPSYYPSVSKDKDQPSSRPWLGFWSRETVNKTEATDSSTNRTPNKTRDSRSSRPVKESISNTTTGSLYRRFRRPRTNNETAVANKSTNQTTLETTSTATQTETVSQNATACPAAADNATTIATTPSTGLILLAPAQQQPGAFRYTMGRSGPSFSQLSKQSQQPNQQSPGTLSPNGLVLIELWLLPVLTVVTRYWFLPWLTSWLTRQEDSVHAVQRFAFERLNDRYSRDAAALQTALSTPPLGWSRLRWRRITKKSAIHNQFLKNKPANVTDMYAKTVIVIELNSMDTMMKSDSFDLKALADICSFLLLQHRSHAFGTHTDQTSPAELEIVLLVTSPGGSVSSFGLAASHVQRLAQEPGIQLTVCVDKYAASGGYMIASQAHKLLAAPFATIGSIGVIMEALNVNELLKRYGVKPLVVKAGESKNPISRFGEVTKKDIAHEEKSLEKVHQAFKYLIVKGRPALQDKLDQVSDGSVWLGEKALELNLVDDIMTSSEYIQQHIESFDRVLKLHRANPNRNVFRLSSGHPLDLVPHLKAWATEKLTGEAAGRTLSFLVQLAGVVGMLHHAFHKGPR